MRSIADMSINEIDTWIKKGWGAFAIFTVLTIAFFIRLANKNDEAVFRPYVIMGFCHGVTISISAFSLYMLYVVRKLKRHCK